jgi:hypothetical protein
MLFSFSDAFLFKWDKRGAYVTMMIMRYERPSGLCKSASVIG